MNSIVILKFLPVSMSYQQLRMIINRKLHSSRQGIFYVQYGNEALILILRWDEYLCIDLSLVV